MPDRAGISASRSNSDIAATPAEAALESLLNHLGNGVLRGQFRREWPVGDWFIDVYFPGVALAIEVDGGYHRALSRWRKDLHKTRDLEARGITVLRLTNSEVLGNQEHIVTRLRAAWRAALERSRALRGAGVILREPEAPDYLAPVARVRRCRAMRNSVPACPVPRVSSKLSGRVQNPYPPIPKPRRTQHDVPGRNCKTGPCRDCLIPLSDSDPIGVER